MIGITALLLVVLTGLVLTTEASEKDGWELRLWSAGEQLYKMLR